MYIKLVTVKTKEKIYYYVRVCERRYTHLTGRKKEFVVATLGTFDEVRPTAVHLAIGLKRISKLFLSSSPRANPAMHQQDKRTRAGAKV